MATQAGGFVRDQNLNVHFDVAPSTLKTNKPQKNGRKALGDISNSRRPSANLPPNKQHGLKNMVSAAEDFVPTNLSKSSFGGSKTKVTTKGSGRKALGDLTNSINRLVVLEPNQACSKKLSVVVEEPLLDSEGFGKDYLHDHGECVKAQQKAKAIDMEYFFKGYVQASLSPEQAPRSSADMKFQPESPIKFSEMEKMLGGECNRHEMSAEVICASPTSVPRYQWENDMIFHLNLSP